MASSFTSLLDVYDGKECVSFVLIQAQLCPKIIRQVKGSKT